MAARKKAKRTTRKKATKKKAAAKERKPPAGTVRMGATARSGNIGLSDGTEVVQLKRGADGFYMVPRHLRAAAKAHGLADAPLE